jgi:hypothetical protein
MWLTANRKSVMILAGFGSTRCLNPWFHTFGRLLALIVQKPLRNSLYSAGNGILRHSPDLIRVSCRTPQQMILANALCRAWETRGLAASDDSR